MPRWTEPPSAIEAVGEDLFSLILGNHQQVAIGRGQLVKAQLNQGAIAVADSKLGKLHAAFGQFLGNPQLFQHFKGVSMYDGCAGRVLSLFKLVNEQVIDTSLLKGDGEGRACRSGSYDKNVGIGCKHC